MIREIDARTAPDDTLALFHEIELACHDELAPGEPPRSRGESIAFHRFQPTTHTSCHWLADGGYAELHAHGPAATFVDVLVVPEARRRGIGRALLDAAAARARELGASALHGAHATPAGAAFARAVGAHDSGQRIVHSVLDLQAAELPEPSVPVGWRIVTWLGRVPDEHLEAFVVARAAMSDAPAPGELDFPEWDAAKVRASEESLRLRDREMRLAVAMRDDGTIGSFSELRLSRGSVSGFTDDTGTTKPHRGLGLARAVKLESLRRLRSDHPEVEVVTTSNAEENETMLHINRSVGFRPTVTWTTATLPL